MPHRPTYHEIEGSYFATCTCGWRSHLWDTYAQVQEEHTQHREDA